MQRKRNSTTSSRLFIGGTNVTKPATMSNISLTAATSASLTSRTFTQLTRTCDADTVKLSTNVVRQRITWYILHRSLITSAQKTLSDYRAITRGVFRRFKSLKFQSNIWQASLKIPNCPLHPRSTLVFFCPATVSFLTKTASRRWLLLQGWKVKTANQFRPRLSPRSHWGSLQHCSDS